MNNVQYLRRAIPLLPAFCRVFFIVSGLTRTSADKGNQVPAKKTESKKKKTKAPTDETSEPSKSTRQPWPTDGVATYKDAATFLKVCTKTIQRMVKRGELIPTQVSRKGIRFAWSHLHERAQPASVQQAK
jgi:hypothetical protein